MLNSIVYGHSCRKIDIPPKVRALMKMLLDKGFEVYCVGGCVRDSFMRLSPADWDLCTSALPHRIKEIFSSLKTVETGIKHGTVTVISDGESFEITTFRRDGDYSDGRRPDKVEFVTSIREDLSRRDFTMNAMAADVNGLLLDPFDGCGDINRGIIKCVGDGKLRFEEDALRILRALRFASRFGFDIEENTRNALLEKSALLKNISAERISKELCPVLLGRYCGKVLLDYSHVFTAVVPWVSDAIDTVYPDTDMSVWEVTARSVNAAPADILVKLSLFYHGLGLHDYLADGQLWGYWNHSAKIAENSLRALKFDNFTVSNTVELIRNFHVTLSPHKPLLLRYLNRLGLLYLERIISMREALDSVLSKGTESHQEVLTMLWEIEKSGECYKTSHLAINGQDLLHLGFKEGKHIGEILEALLEAVMNGRVQNVRDDLLSLAQQTMRK